MSRRRFLTSSAAGAAAFVWRPAFRVTQAATAAAPAGFPPGIELYRQAYENWSREIVVDDVWTCAPRTAADVVRLANWARGARYRLRARGKMHGWSPLTIGGAASPDDRIVLVDTTRHLTRTGVDPATSTVRVQAGATMASLLGSLEAEGLGFTAVPATGDITVGGVLAIGGHGTGVPARGERPPAGHGYGTLSDLVVSITAVVWNASRRAYELRTFRRDDHPSASFLVHIGRAFVTDVTLRVGANPMLRCQSFTDVAASELFAAHPRAGTTSIAGLLDRAGRVETIWYPFTDHPWVKVWSVSPTKPAASRAVEEPYNYPFSDNIPLELAQLADEIVTSRPESTPLFGRMLLAATRAGLAGGSADIWGPSKNVLLYIKASTLRVHEMGYVVLTKRRDVQRVLAEVATYFTERLAAHEARGEYPINMPIEFRVSGVDRAGRVDVPGAEPPLLSPAAAHRDHPEWDVAVWISTLTLPGTKHAERFFGEFESWLLGRYDGGWALARPEWSKGWAYSAAGAWTRNTVLDGLGSSRPDGDWERATGVLRAADPHGVFSNELLDRMVR